MMLPPPTDEQRAKWYAEGCALIEQIERTPNFERKLLKVEGKAVSDFRGRGPGRATEIALVRLRLILEWVGRRTAQ